MLPACCDIERSSLRTVAVAAASRHLAAGHVRPAGPAVSVLLAPQGLHLPEVEELPPLVVAGERPASYQPAGVAGRREVEVQTLGDELSRTDRFYH